MENFRPDISFARHLDSEDSLAHFRERFVIEDPDLIYLDGNSLGRLPKETAVHLQKVVSNEWGHRLIQGWNDGWISLQERVGAKVARLIGAMPNEVMIADSTSVNLFKLVYAAVEAQPGRHKIVTDDLNFPSDLYILQGIAQLVQRPLHIHVVPSLDGIHGPVDGLIKAIDADTALVALSHTTFKSSYTYNMVEITSAAHQAGAMMLWDMSHSVGSVPGQLNEAGAELAVGCTYKYVNGGPGSPAFLYVRQDLQDKLINPISGWMGQKDMFEFGLAYIPAPGMRHFITGTPPILSIATIEPGVDLLLEAGIKRLREKSMMQSSYLVQLWDALLRPLAFRLNSPEDVHFRGSHISFGHEHGWGISQALIQEMKVLPDFRKPDLIRFGIAPIYNSFEEIYTAVSHLQHIVNTKLYRAYESETKLVT